ncbi:hypothetical protein [Sphingobacterium sp. UME9]|uniref:hypothetical protein n=1 Tax=Sphingobacterium sp. UME9 TaxID=1862316 RepID=UPI00160429A0|nr:hypothetical protein [Sphingobacterium sp. UME9]MBB1644514.1 hypothetical protein [Sphingobacterium sp. UME9]
MNTYVYNVVVFKGENSENILSHFKQMPIDSPPFEAILVQDNTLYFDSKQFPPIRDLSEIAEKFDVNYTLECSAWGIKSNYIYVCHQKQALSHIGEEIRQSINNCTSPDELRKADQSLLQEAYMGKLDNHQFFVLKQIVGKKNRELNPTREEDQEVTRSRGRGR